MGEVQGKQSIIRSTYRWGLTADIRINSAYNVHRLSRYYLRVLKNNTYVKATAADTYKSIQNIPTLVLWKQ